MNDTMRITDLLRLAADFTEMKDYELALRALHKAEILLKQLRTAPPSDPTQPKQVIGLDYRTFSQ